MDGKLYLWDICRPTRKAFDTVEHQLLLHKLHRYRVWEIINNWFSSYFLGPQQTAQIGAKRISKKETILSGSSLLYAINANKNFKSLKTIVNFELSNIHDWLAANKLSLNFNKSNFVLFHTRQKKLNYKVDLKVFDYHTNTYIS